MEEDIITLQFTAELSTPIGYAQVFECEVQGKDSDIKYFDLTVLSKDTYTSIGKKIYESHSGILVGKFRKKNENEPYLFAIITGFVDNDKTSWELIELKPLESK